MKACPYCAEEIQDAALICRFCGRDIRTGRSADAPMDAMLGAASRTNTMAIVSIVCSVAAFFAIPVIGSILGIALGHRARREIAESGGAQGGDGLATAGIVAGWVGLVVILIPLLAICSFAGSR